MSEPSRTVAGSMDRARSSLIIGLIITIAASTALIASDALAGKKLKTKSATVEIPEGELGSVTATCKKKQKAVSGGFEGTFDPASMTTSEIFPFTSLREGKRGWHSAGVNLTDPGPFTSHAYCRKQKMKVASAEVEAPPPPVGGGPVEVTAVAKCPKGMKALSGGFDNPDADFSAPDTTVVLAKVSRRDGGRRWEVRGANLGDTEGTLTARVNCHEGKRLKAEEASVTLEDGSALAREEVESRCPKKKRLISGGFASDVQPTATGPLFVASKRIGKLVWHLDAASNTGQEPEITSYAYCEKKRK